VEKLLARLGIAVSIFFCLSFSATAEVITKSMPNGLTASADFFEGEIDKPVVLILHGFMQTHNFSTVARLANSLKEEGYTVLVPTLTLNINNRKESLACEAIHTHTMQGDVAEVVDWIDWLYARTQRNITLIAHSAGSTHLLATMEGKTDPRIDRLILISLLHFHEDPLSQNTIESYQRALSDVKQDKQGLFIYDLAFCKKYPSEPEAFLSYREWVQERTIAALNNLTLPTTIIIGGNDYRMRPAWREALMSTRVDVITMKDAGHFFDTQFEFDLLDLVIEITSD
jgi:pimeloyl-ACP methyl ester carboxylesterase